MSQIVLDEHLAAAEVIGPLKKRFKVLRLQDLRPDEHILDDRVPEILRSLSQPTFVTLDEGFWLRRLCHPDYCILHFALRDDQQELLLDLLPALLRHAEFRTRRARMGNVARISTATVQYWNCGTAELKQFEWQATSRRRRR